MISLSLSLIHSRRVFSNEVTIFEGYQIHVHTLYTYNGSRAGEANKFIVAYIVCGVTELFCIYVRSAIRPTSTEFTMELRFIFIDYIR